MPAGEHQDSARITVGIAPALKQGFGPEIAWALRQVLATLGYAWCEVDLDDPAGCTLAYGGRAARASAALHVDADPLLWAKADRLRWHGGDGSSRGQSFVEFDVLENGAAVSRIRTADPVFLFYWLGTGVEERHVPQNRHGHHDFSGTPWLRDGLFRRAVASRFVSALGDSLRALGLECLAGTWPDGKRAAFCCGHDVDYPEVIRWLEPARILGRQGIAGCANAGRVLAGRKTHWSFREWTALEQRYGLRSAFYFVARQGSLWQYARSTPDPFYDVRTRRFRDLFHEIIDDGHEIGTQASYWAFRDVEMLRVEKATLEEAAGAPVVGNRHHYWHLDPHCPEATLEMHERLGYEYDSSLTHDRYLGWRRSICTPFFPFHRGGRREIGTLQIPTAWMDDQLFGHRGSNPGDRPMLLQDLLDTAVEVQGCVMVDVHEYVFDDDLYPGWRKTYEGLLADVAGRGDVWLATPREIARHWRERYVRLRSASVGLDA